MTYRTEFPSYKSVIPEVFLAPPWTDHSFHNDSCPSFMRSMGDGREVHVFVDEEDPSERDTWTARDGTQTPCPRYSIQTTDAEGSFDDEASFATDSLIALLDQVGFLCGEVSR